MSELMTSEELKRARWSLGLTQAELARAIGMSANGGSKIRRIENGAYPATTYISTAVRALLVAAPTDAQAGADRNHDGS